MSRTINRWRMARGRMNKHGRPESLPERQYPIVPPALPTTLRMKSIILEDDLVVEGAITTGGDDPSQSPSDGLPPTASPTPTVVGGPRWLGIQWTAQPNVDLITYDVYVGTAPGFTTDATTLATSTPGNMIFVYSVNGTPLAYNTNYYVKLIARDIDGSAPVGGEVGPNKLDPNRNPDIFAGAITADKLAAVMVLASALVAGTVGGARVELGYTQDGAGNVDSSKIGVRSFAADGTTRTFEVNALTGDVYVKGLIDWGTTSHLYGSDIAEIARQPLPVGFQTPALIQQVSKTSTAASVNITWPSPTQSGNLLVLVVYVVHGLVPPDTAPNITTPAGWTQRHDQQFIDNIEGTGNTSRMKIFSRASTGQSGAQTFALTGQATFYTVSMMFEFSGVQDVLDTNGTSALTGNNQTTLAGNVLPSAGTSTQDGLAFGAISSVNNSGVTPALTVTGGFTASSPASRATDIVNGIMELVCGYKAIGTAATATPGATSSLSTNYITLGVLFKAKANTAVAPAPAAGSNAVRVYAKQAMWDEVKFASKPESGIETYLDPLANLPARFTYVTDLTIPGGQAAAGSTTFLDTHIQADTLGAGSAVAAILAAASHPGVMDLSPGTTATGRAELKTRTNSIVPVTSDRVRLVFIIKTDAALSDGTNRYRAYMGLSSDTANPGAAATNQVTVWYSDLGVAAGGTNGVWNLQASNGAAIAANPMVENGGSVTVAINTWYRIEIEFVVGTGVSVWINGTKKLTNYNTNMPASGATMQAFVSNLKALGLTNRSVFVDAIGIDHTFATSR